LSVDAGVPIVPIVIFNTGSIMPKGKLLIRTRSVRMDILKPISTSDYTRKTKDDLMDTVRNTICSAFEEKACE